METFISFFNEYANLIYVLVGLSLLAITTATIGNFLVLRKQALLGDAISHAVLPGLVISFLFFETKNTYVLLGGAFISGYISVFLIDWIVSRSKIKYDAALAIILTMFFGAGMMLLTYIQQKEIGNQSGLETYIFGSAATLIGPDLINLGIITVITIAVIILFYKELKAFVFEKEYFKIISSNYKFIQFIYLTLIVVAIVIGINVFGVVLISALLITPAVSASFWSHSLKKRIVISSIFGVVSSIGAAVLSLYVDNMPTGPWVVIILGICLVFSLFTGKYYKNKTLQA